MRGYFLLIFLFLLSGCVIHPRDATVSLRENGRVDVDIYAGPPPQIAALMADGSGSNSEAQRARIDRDIRTARECIGGNLIFDPKTFELRLSVRDQTQRQVENRLKCADDLDDLVDLDVETEEGWLWDTVSLNLDLWFDDGYLDTQGSPIVAHPSQIVFEFPKNGSVEIVSQSRSLEIEVEDSDKSAIAVEFSTDVEEWQRFVSMHNKDRDCERRGAKTAPKCPVREPYYSNVQLRAYYTKANYSINDVLVLFSIIFGSGIAVTWFSKISRKDKE